MQQAGKQLAQLMRMVHIVIELVYSWLGTALWAKKLRGLRVLVTGAGRPVGSEISEQLAALGCHVLCVDADPAVLDEVMVRVSAAAAAAAAAAGDALGLPGPRAFVCDVADKESVLRLAQDVADLGWPVDMLVLAPPTGSSPIECLTQHFLPTLAFVPAMVSRGTGGHIVFMEDSSTPSTANASAEAWSECFDDLDQMQLPNVQVTRVLLGESPPANQKSAARAARCIVSAVRRDVRNLNVLTQVS